MENIVNFMDHWQTLIGAIIGGLFALTVALLVAFKARRREEISAAMLLVGNLVSVKAAEETLMEQASEENVEDAILAPWVAEKLVWPRPRLSPMFEASLVRVMPISAVLSAHLDLFHTIYADVERHLERLAGDFEEVRRNGKPLRTKEAMNADASLARKGFAIAAAHAKCAERLLTQLVLSQFPTWHRVRRVILPSKDERQCNKRLKQGST